MAEHETLGRGLDSEAQSLYILFLFLRKYLNTYLYLATSLYKVWYEMVQKRIAVISVATLKLVLIRHLYHVIMALGFYLWEKTIV